MVEDIEIDKNKQKKAVSKSKQQSKTQVHLFSYLVTSQHN